MRKTRHLVIGVGVLTVCVFSLIFSRPAQAADESLTLETYYPAPYGAYAELTTTGNTYLATEGGYVGIGKVGPQEKLDVAGKVRIGDISNFYTLPEQRGTEGQVLKLTDSSGSVGWENEASLASGSLSNVVRASIINGRFTVFVFDAGDNKKIHSAYILWSGSSWPVLDIQAISSFVYIRYDITIRSNRLSFDVELKKGDGSTYTTLPSPYTFYYVVNYTTVPL